MKKTFEDQAYHSYTTKLSVSIVYALIASIALNFSYQPGYIYSSDITGLAQILTTLSKSLMGLEVPVSTTLYLLNIPLFVLAWFKVGEEFTTFTFIIATSTSLYIHILSETVLSTDPITRMLFGGAMVGPGVGLALRDGLSPGGLDVVGTMIREETGKSIGSISIYSNVLIVFVARTLFGWQYMSYSMLPIFVSEKVTDVIHAKQKEMQVMIVTKHPEKVVSEIQDCIHKGITIINGAEGVYRHDKQIVLVTIVIRCGLPLLKKAMKASNPQALASIAENAQIFGRFYGGGI